MSDIGRAMRHPRHGARKVLAFVVVVAAVLAPGRAASAHAELERTTPADGAALATAPTQIVLEFTERVEATLGAVRVLDGAGKPVPMGPAGHLDGNASTIAASLPSIGDGTYVVAWRALSSDSHPVFGSFSFRVGDGPAVDTAGLRARALAGSHAARSVAVGLGVMRWLVFAGAAIGLGLVAFVTALWPAGADERRVRRTAVTALVILAAASLGSIAFQGAYATAGGLGQVLDASLWSSILRTRFGEAAVARALIAAALAVTAGIRPHLLTDRVGRAVGALAGGVLLGTVAASGHATTGVQPMLGVALDLGHLAAMTMWVGALAGLVVAVWSASTTVADVHALARKVSPMALAATGVLVVTGVAQGWRQVGDRAGLFTTFGRLLTGKVVLVGIVLLVALSSRRAVRAWRRGSEHPDVFSFGRTVVTELVLIAVVVAATTTLVATAPGRETAGGPTTIAMNDRDTRMTLTIDPARHGIAAFHLYLSPPGGSLQPVQEARVQLSLPGKGIDRLDVPVDAAGPNHYTTEVGSVPLAGQWQVKVTALISEFDQRTFVTTVRFR